MTDLIRVIKGAVDIVELAEECGVELKQRGALYQGVCPFHDDHKPSLTVYPKTQSWYCFGCSLSGDIFDFWQKIKGVDFKEALTQLAKRAGIEIKALSEAEGKALEKKRRKQDLLTSASFYYHKQLSDEVRAYLTEERGLLPETLNTQRIGYAPKEGGLLACLGSQDFSKEEVVRAGLIYPDGKEYFSGHIVFPNWLGGKVLYISGRGWPEKSHRKLPADKTPLEHFFCEDALRGKEVVVAEGEIDCLTLRQVGFNACGILGVGGFKEEWLKKFRNVELVHIALDGDEAGKEASIKVAQLLLDKAKIIRFPREGDDIKDWNDLYVKKYGKDRKSFQEAFSGLMSDARGIIEYMLDEIPPETPKTDLVRRLGPVLFLLAKIKDEALAGAYLRHNIKNRFGLTIKDIKDYEEKLKQMRKDLDEKEREKRRLEKEQKDTEKPKMSEEERREAEDLLKEPELTVKFLEDKDSVGCVGEDDNALILFLAMTSRLTDRPLNIIVKGGSSGGKNWVVDHVASFIPAEEKHVKSRISAKALDYFGKDLRHKVLIIKERAGAEEADYSVRILQSEGEIEVDVVVKDPKTGEFKTQTHKVRGPVCYIETTTKASLNPENENRCLVIHIDESVEQTKKIHLAQSAKYSLNQELKPEQIEAKQTKWQNAQRLLKPYRVLIPYVDLIEFPTSPLRVRRDHAKFLNLIAASAILHQYQREKFAEEGEGRIVANIFDYEVVYKLAKKIFDEAVKGLSPKGEEVVNLAFQIKEEKEKKGDEGTVSTGDLQERVDWSRSTLGSYCKQAVEAGCLEPIEGGRGKEYKYKSIKKPEEVSVLLSPRELEAKWRSSQQEQRPESKLTEPDERPLAKLTVY